jgi:hypothetical protein
VSVRGEFAWPYLGRSGDRPWGILMAAYGEFRVAAVTVKASNRCRRAQRSIGRWCATS